MKSKCELPASGFDVSTVHFVVVFLRRQFIEQQPQEYTLKKDDE